MFPTFIKQNSLLFAYLWLGAPPSLPFPLSYRFLSATGIFFHGPKFSFPLKFFVLSYIPSLRRNTFPQKAALPPPPQTLKFPPPFFHSFSSIVLSFSISFSVSCRHKIRINGKDTLSLHQPFAITAVRCCMGLRIRV